MSLLMQALKKAERAKQNSAQDGELEKPSEAFDEVLALTPQEPAAPAPTPAPPARDFTLDMEPMGGLSLSPLPDTAAPPASPPAPPAAGGDDAIPVLTVAAEAIHDPVPPQARQVETAAQETPPPKPEPRAKADGGAPRGAARARAAAAAPPPTGGLDAAKIRLIILCGIAALIAAVFGYIYWQATSAPGAGARLPMVPMPPPGATGASSALVVLPKGGAPAAAPPLDTPPPPENDGRDQGRDGKSDHEAALERQLSQIQAQLQAQAAQQHAPGPDTLPPVVAPDNSEIRVAHSSAPPQTDPALLGGYQAFARGDLARAQQQYELALKQDPNSRDALLGVAAVAVRQNQGQQAAATYLRLLELDPNDADALAGLIGLRQGDATQAELRLKTVLARNPEAGAVQFALGNLYARQGRWPEAQQAYFRAWSAVPGNADYAFNLAIGLDRLNQGKLAVTYYQKALALAQDAPAGFDRGALRKRLHELNSAQH